MSTTYGVSRSFGSLTISNSGFRSKEAAILNVYERAFAKSKWRPSDLRQKWWQFWLQKDHDEETRIFIKANPDWQER